MTYKLKQQLLTELDQVNEKLLNPPDNDYQHSYLVRLKEDIIFSISIISKEKQIIKEIFGKQFIITKQSIDKKSVCSDNFDFNYYDAQDKLCDHVIIETEDTLQLVTMSYWKKWAFSHDDVIYVIPCTKETGDYIMKINKLNNLLEIEK